MINISEPLKYSIKSWLDRLIIIIKKETRSAGAAAEYDMYCW
jgi:hypothetical protein